MSGYIAWAENSLSTSVEFICFRSSNLPHTMHSTPQNPIAPPQESDDYNGAYRPKLKTVQRIEWIECGMCRI